jgi:hypothetical protein
LREEKLANLFKNRKLKFSKLTLCRRSNNSNPNKRKRKSKLPALSSNKDSSAASNSTSANLQQSSSLLDMSTNSYEATQVAGGDDSPAINITQPLLGKASKQPVLAKNSSEASLALAQLPVMEQFLRHARNGDLAAIIDLVEQSNAQAAHEQAVDAGKYAKIVNNSFDFNYRGLTFGFNSC